MESIKKLEEQFVMNQQKNEESHMKLSGEVVVFTILYLSQAYCNR